MINRILVGLVAGSCLLSTGCSSEPTVEELARSIFNAAAENSDVSLSHKQAECIAKELLDSGLSQATLEGLVDNFNTPRVLDIEAPLVSDQVKVAATACIQ